MDSMFGLKPASLYNGMIAPPGSFVSARCGLVPGRKQFPKAWLYPRLFSALATTWRKQFNSPECPFLLVQLPAFNDLYGGFPFTWMREAQLQTVHDLPHSALAATFDTCDGIQSASAG